jgi:hypothetical protein
VFTLAATAAAGCAADAEVDEGARVSEDELGAALSPMKARIGRRTHEDGHSEDSQGAAGVAHGRSRHRGGCAVEPSEDEGPEDGDEEEVASSSDALSVRSITRPCDVDRQGMRVRARAFCNVQSNFREVYFRKGICTIGLSSKMWFTC